MKGELPGGAAGAAADAPLTSRQLPQSCATPSRFWSRGPRPPAPPSHAAGPLGEGENEGDPPPPLLLVFVLGGVTLGEVRALLQLFADFNGLNMVASDTVGGSLTLRLKNVPWDQALDVILKTKGLDQERRGGIIRVAPKPRLDAERQARLDLAEQRRNKIPTTVRLIPVNYAVANELVPQVQALLSNRGRVTSDQRTNVIIVEDIRDNLEQAERLVRTLDTQTPQVLIEARIVEASLQFVRQIGIAPDERPHRDVETPRNVVAAAAAGEPHLQQPSHRVVRFAGDLIGLGA